MKLMLPSPAIFADVSSAADNRESSDMYCRVVVRLNTQWRVVECRDGIQWILQYGKKSGHRRIWRGNSYCRTRNALIRCVTQRVGEIEQSKMQMLRSLSERFPENDPITDANAETENGGGEDDE
ncbi:MAG: hypothetical protein AAFY99_11420 [Pseudomonadota bacterium]